jgi:hypothetical protein
VSGPLATAFFWIAVVATAVAHAFILRSTIRGMREGAASSSAARAATGAGSPAAGTSRARTFWEWTWAVLPAIALIVLFVWTWNTMHPDTLTIPLPAGRVMPGSIGT